jgi:glycolate oxidase FAD binding subunit
VLPSTAPAVERPTSVEEAAGLLREIGEAGRPLRVLGGGTKLGWSAVGVAPEVEVQTTGLARVLEHNQGDFTAVLEAGASLAEAQARFAEAGQMLALDPPLGERSAASPRATIGGVVATADSGPLRHRYGGVRDLVLGVTVVLSDGTVGKAGGRVIKNVAGYDLGKLFAGSRGTLGMIAAVGVRLHPITAGTATARASSSEHRRLAEAAVGLAALPLEADCLDVAWQEGSGSLLVRFSGPTAAERAQTTVNRLRELGLEDTEVAEDDEQLWTRQRDGQRRCDGVVVKVAGVIGQLETVLAAAESCGAAVVSRVALGLSWVAFAPTDDLAQRVGGFRAALPDASLTVLDGAAAVEHPWPAPPAGVQRVMERIKARFDPANVFNPGAFGEWV